MTIISFLCLAIPAQAKDAPQSIDVDGLKVAVWLPQEMQGAPVVLFSHGFHGCDTQSTFLMEALAKAGYAVFAPNHKDATCDGGTSSWRTRFPVPFGEPEKWNDTIYSDRGADMKRLIAQLPEDVRYRMLDWKHVGLSGHSLGGYTVLALAGGWPSWKDKRISAVLALSPYSAPFAVQHTLGNISVPVMYQGGTWDRGITPGVEKEGGAYDQTPAPKYFVDITRAGHLAFADIRDQHHDVMAAYAVAFFDTWLKGKPFPAGLKQQGEGVAELRIDESR